MLCFSIFTFTFIDLNEKKKVVEMIMAYKEKLFPWREYFTWIEKEKDQGEKKKEGASQFFCGYMRISKLGKKRFDLRELAS